MPAIGSLVLDAGALIKLQRLERLEPERLVATEAIIGEVRDEKARAHMRTLTQEIERMQPAAQDLLYTTHFARKTGDGPFLSSNDLGIIALAAQLHRERGGLLRDEPCAEAVFDDLTVEGAFQWAPKEAADAGGADNAEEEEEWSEEEESAEQPEADADGSDSDGGWATVPEKNNNSHAPGKQAAMRAVETPVDEVATGLDATKVPDDGDYEEESDLSGDEGWVTAENIHKFADGHAAREQMDEDRRVEVAVMSSDFSVQNVLLQMGIPCVTIDGFRVRSVKLWALLCRACGHQSRDTEKIFCGKCGHSTVARVPCSVDRDGTIKVHDNPNRRINLKGTIYSIPKRKGGRERAPVFAQDELMMGDRAREMRRRKRLAQKEAALANPFDESNNLPWYHRGTTKTGKLHNLDSKLEAGYGRRNVNANNFKFRTRK